MSYFGGLTDHFGIATSGLILVESSKVKVPLSRADAPDENGDPADTTYFGNTAGTLYDISCTYALKSGTLALLTLKLGELTAGTVAEKIDIETANGANPPKVTLTGKLGAQTVTAPTGKANTYIFPLAMTLSSAFVAQPYGAAVSAGRLTSCKISAGINIAQQDNGVGEPAAHGVSGGAGEVSFEVVRTSASAPALGTPEAGFTVTDNGLEEPQAAHHMATFKLQFTMEREDAA